MCVKYTVRMASYLGGRHEQTNEFGISATFETRKKCCYVATLKGIWTKPKLSSLSSESVDWAILFIEWFHQCFFTEENTYLEAEGTE